MKGDDWDDEWDQPVTLMMGAVQAAGMPEGDEPDDPLDLRWQALYVPDATSRTGWGVHRVRDRSPQPMARARRIGFRMRRHR